MRRWRSVLLFVALLLASVALWAQGFAVLRAPARDLGLGEAGGAAVAGAERSLINPAGLSSTARNYWLEAGDSSGVRQQRAGLADAWGPWNLSLDLGLDSVQGLQLRSDQGDLLGEQDLWAPWSVAAVSHPAWLGSWGLAAGARDRRWLGGGASAEAGLGWILDGPWSLGAALWWRDGDGQGQASLAWQPEAWPFRVEGGVIAEGAESRWGLGAQWRLTQALGLRVGWLRWTQAENQRLSVGLGWDGVGQSFSYGWLPATGIGSTQKLAVRWGQVPTPTPIPPTATATPSPSATATMTPRLEIPLPSLTFTPTPARPRKELELDFVLPQ